MKRFLAWSLLSISLGTARAARAQTAGPADRAPTTGPASSVRLAGAVSPAPSGRAPTTGPASSARATASSPARVPPPAARPAPAPPPAADAPSFSPIRFVVESLVGFLMGSAGYYGAMRAFCPEGSCTRGEVAGFGASLIATPVAVSVAGWSMGGQGTLSSAMMGEIIGFALGNGLAPLNRQVSLGIGLTLGPTTSAGLFESRENSEPTGFMLGRIQVHPYAAPTLSPTGTLGGTLGLTGQF
jgi:hypothetical protein